MHAEQAGEGTGSTTGGGHRLVSPPASAPPAPRCGCSAAAAAGCPRSAGLQADGNSSAQAAIMPVPGKSRAAGGVSAAATRHTRRRCRCPTCQEGATRRGMLPSQSGDGPDPAGRRGAPSGLQGELHGPRAAARRGAAAAPICKHLRTGCRWWGGAPGPPGRPPWQPVQPPLLCSSGEEVWLLPASREDGTMPRRRSPGFFVRGLLRPELESPPPAGSLPIASL